MGGGYVCKYVEVYLQSRQIQNCQTWGLGAQYLVDRVNLENSTLVYCGSGFKSYCVNGGDECRYYGVDVS